MVAVSVGFAEGLPPRGFIAGETGVDVSVIGGNWGTGGKLRWVAVEVDEEVLVEVLLSFSSVLVEVEVNGLRQATRRRHKFQTGS